MKNMHGKDTKYVRKRVHSMWEVVSKLVLCTIPLIEIGEP